MYVNIIKNAPTYVLQWDVIYLICEENCDSKNNSSPRCFDLLFMQIGNIDRYSFSIFKVLCVYILA